MVHLTFISDTHKLGKDLDPLVASIKAKIKEPGVFIHGGDHMSETAEVTGELEKILEGVNQEVHERISKEKDLLPLVEKLNKGEQIAEEENAKVQKFLKDSGMDKLMMEKMQPFFKAKFDSAYEAFQKLGAKSYVTTIGNHDNILLTSSKFKTLTGLTDSLDYEGIKINGTPNSLEPTQLNSVCNLVEHYVISSSKERGNPVANQIYDNLKAADVLVLHKGNKFKKEEDAVYDENSPANKVLKDHKGKIVLCGHFHKSRVWIEGGNLYIRSGGDVVYDVNITKEDITITPYSIVSTK